MPSHNSGIYAIGADNYILIILSLPIICFGLDYLFIRLRHFATLLVPQAALRLHKNFVPLQASAPG